MKFYLITFYMTLGLLISGSCVADKLLPFNKVIIWGHKLHSHTHSYVHYGFYKAFKYLGYETYWFDNNDAVQNFDFTNSLFITEGQVDQKMPLRDDCRYILHYCFRNRQDEYAQLFKKGCCISLYTYLNEIHFHDYRPKRIHIDQMREMEKCITYNVDEKFIYMPWATDLLPYEIDQIKKDIKLKKRSNAINWVGTIGGPYYGPVDQLKPFVKACNENHISFNHITNVDTSQNISLIQQSYMAPAIQGEWQIKNGYIPCRIFKNISYGQMGVTNSKTVYELFDKKIVYNEDTYQLFYDAKKRLERLEINELYDLMDFVKTKHTYLNRIKNLLDFLHMIKPLDNY